MQENFEACLHETLKWEGGFSNHPKDPGGATMKGVTQAVYNSYRKGRALMPRSVRLITWQELLDIYKRLYWNKVHGDDLPGGVDMAVFDLAVNSGPDRAIRFMQAAAGVAVDGQVGPATLAAVKADPRRILDGVMLRRLNFLRGLRTWGTFGKGWQRRVDAISVSAHTLLKDK